MKQLWAPWRMAYIDGAASPPDECFLCRAAADDAPADAHVVERTALTVTVLNRFPYSSGHVMVVPKRHIAELASTTADERAELMALVRHAEMALAEGYHPHGINVGMNLGRPAGAGVLDHLHIHLVPRWNGDTSFMGVVGSTRVLPEDLSQTAARLRPIFERLAKETS